jgi:hypothetical protein
MKRLLAIIAFAYLFLALISRAQEAMGLRTCECRPDCWCKKPGLSMFRWVFPRFHHIGDTEAVS